MDFFYTEIENSGPATARIGIKGHAPLSQFLNSSFILQLRNNIFTIINAKFKKNVATKSSNLAKHQIFYFIRNWKSIHSKEKKWLL